MGPSGQEPPGRAVGGPRPRVPRGARLVLFATDDPQHLGRAKRHERVLAMQPLDQTERAHPSVRATSTRRVYWEYLRASGEPVLVRARSARSAAKARADAEALFARAGELRIVYVHDPVGGQLAWWLVLGREVVLVPARVRAATQRSWVMRDAAQALAAMGEMPPWGEYRPF